MTPAASPDPATRIRDRFERPILIVSTPRSGSTLLFETLARAPGLFSPGGESHSRIEQIADFSPPSRGWTSNRLDASDAADAAVEELARQFYVTLRDRNGRAAAGPVRMLEKTPKNALRVPFFDAAWNDSIFVYLYREPRQTLGSMIEAWLSGRFVTYGRLPGWGRPPWSLLLVPGWRELIGRPLAEVVAAQWATTTRMLVSDLSKLPAERVVGVDYTEFLADPPGTMARLAAACGLEWDVELPPALPFSRYTFTRPAPEKWRRFEAEIERVRPMIAAADAEARAFLEKVRR